MSAHFSERSAIKKSLRLRDEALFALYAFTDVSGSSENVFFRSSADRAFAAWRSLRRRYSTVVFRGRVFAEFLYDGAEVGQRADGREARSVGRADQSAQRAEQQGRFDGLQRHAIFVEVPRQPLVGDADAHGRVRHFQIEGERGLRLLIESSHHWTADERESRS